MAALPSDERPELERGGVKLATVRSFDASLKNRIFGKNIKIFKYLGQRYGPDPEAALLP